MRIVNNESQSLKIEQKNLHIANVIFKYKESTKKDGLNTDIFSKGKEDALMTLKTNKPGHYSLIIQNLSYDNKLPFVADCIKVK